MEIVCSDLEYLRRRSLITYYLTLNLYATTHIMRIANKSEQTEGRLNNNNNRSEYKSLYIHETDR